MEERNKEMGTEQELKATIDDVRFTAETIIVSNQDEYAEAAKFGKVIKAKAKEIAEFFAPMKQAAYDAHKKVCDREKEMLKPLEVAEKMVKGAMNTYLAEQERKRKEEEERARKAAQEEAERLLAEAIKSQEEGKIEEAEEKMQRAEAIDDIGRSLEIAKETVKVDGAYQKTDWEIVNIDSKKVPCEIMGMEIRPVDVGAVMKLIRASKGKIQIEGIEFKEVSKTCFR